MGEEEFSRLLPWKFLRNLQRGRGYDETQDRGGKKNRMKKKRLVICEVRLLEARMKGKGWRPGTVRKRNKEAI